METRANYALIGAFTLIVIASAFAFIFWFSGGNKQANQKAYLVIFRGSVSGLSRGSQVLFNGLPVGEVTQIDLLEADPRYIEATIRVSQRTPVKTNTHAKLESQGLTGIASLALTGGSPRAEDLKARPGEELPTIEADQSDLQNLLEAVQNLSKKSDTLLDNANKLIVDNRDSIHNTLHNVEVFTDALGKNADGINTFLANMSDVGKAIGPLAKKLEALSGDIDSLVQAVDPDQVKSIVGNVNQFTGNLANNNEEISNFVKDAASVAKKLNDTSDKLNALLADADAVAKSIDPAKVTSTVNGVQAFADKLGANKDNVDVVMKNSAELTAKLNESASKIDGLISSLQNFVGPNGAGGNSKGVFADVSAAAQSFRTLSDHLDQRTKEITSGVNRVTGPTAREYEALASDARRTLGELNKTLQAINQNPQQFLFGAKPNIPEYTPGR